MRLAARRAAEGLVVEGGEVDGRGGGGISSGGGVRGREAEAAGERRGRRRSHFVRFGGGGEGGGLGVGVLHADRGRPVLHGRAREGAVLMEDKERERGLRKKVSDVELARDADRRLWDPEEIRRVLPSQASDSSALPFGTTKNFQDRAPVQNKRRSRRKTGGCRRWIIEEKGRQWPRQKKRPDRKTTSSLTVRCPPQLRSRPQQHSRSW